MKLLCKTNKKNNAVLTLKGQLQKKKIQYKLVTNMTKALFFNSLLFF